MIRRGDVWCVQFPHGTGAEISKTRPAVVVSNNAFNRRLNRLQVVPLTSRTTNLHPGQVLLAKGAPESKALADQITTISKQRLQNKVGRVNRHDMANLDRALKLQLGLS